MDVQKIEELIRVLEASPNEELCVQKGDYRVCIRKSPKRAATPARKAKQAAGPAAPRTEPEPKRQYITAPMVGIFHEVEGMSRVGTTVSEGQLVGSIESMKIANDIKSSVAGVVVEVLVEDGTPVEYGQPLFRLEG
jgi:biotin carboxyl carrier protein